MKYNSLLLFVFLGFSTISCSQSGPEFTTPESVIEYFVQNISVGNFDNAMKTSAYYYDHIINKISSREMALYLNAILPSTQFNAPDQYNTLLKSKALGQLAFQIQYLVSSLLLPEQFDETFFAFRPVRLSDNEHILDVYFTYLSDTRRLSSLEIIRMDISNPEFQLSDDYIRGSNRLRVVYGFDERVDYSVLYRLNNQYFIGGFVLFRYGNNWYVNEYYSILQNKGPTGRLEKISGIEEYVNEINTRR